MTQSNFPPNVAPPPAARDERPAGSGADPGPGPAEREHTVLGRDGVEIRIVGRLLAYGTSERDEHSHPVPGDAPRGHPDRYAEPGDRCSACRWFEVGIYAVAGELAGDDRCTCSGGDGGANGWHEDRCGVEPASGRYLVVTAGRTVVPDELDFRRAEFTDSPFDVVELLRVESRRDRALRDRNGIPDAAARRSLPALSARALAQAAAFDGGIRDAFVALRGSASGAAAA